MLRISIPEDLKSFQFGRMDVNSELAVSKRLAESWELGAETRDESHQWMRGAKMRRLVVLLYLVRSS
jgi:hypothetical protein